METKSGFLFPDDATTTNETKLRIDFEIEKSSIVVLDSGTLRMMGDQRAWLDSMGEVTLYDRTNPSEMHERARDAGILIMAKCPFDAALFDRLPKLKYTSVLGTGNDMTDISNARERGITVTSVSDHCTGATAQHILCPLAGNDQSRRISFCPCDRFKVGADPGRGGRGSLLRTSAGNESAPELLPTASSPLMSPGRRRLR